MSKILITGGSGLVGKALTERLLEKGYSVNWLSRSEKQNNKVKTYIWDLDKQFIDKKAFDGVSHIIHLAGANISEKAWTDSYKKLIASSRIQTAQLLFDYVKKLQVPLETFISASAIGYYGTFTSDKTLTEDAPPGNDFLAKVCVAWEAKAQKFSDELKIRSVYLRTGVVMDKEEGALPQIKKPIALGLGAPLGSGKQYMPWIHIDDLANSYIKALEDNNLQGAYNATAPEQITNKQVTQQIADFLQKPLLLPPVPAFILKVLLGERASLLLKGAPIIPERILNEGFSFQFPTFNSAIQNILG